MKRILIALFVLTITAVAAEQPCPVEFWDVETGASAVRVKWYNTSDKAILGARFKGEFTNSLQEKFPSNNYWSTDTRLDPKKSALSYWSIISEINKHGRRLGVEIWPVKIAYSDGSIWENEGRACSSGVRK